MNKNDIRNRVKGLMGKDLLPDDTTIEALKLEMADLVIFKESIDMEFGNIFDIGQMTACNTVGELATYVVNTVNASTPVSVTKEATPVSEDIGFLIQDIAANDTEPLNWNDLPAKVKAIFNKVLNTGIDKTKANISSKDALYLFSYIDADADFSALYIIYKEQLIFQYEN